MQNKKIAGLPQKTFLAILGGLILLVAIAISLYNQKGKTLSPEAAKLKTETYINENLMPSGSKVTVESIKEYKGELYELKINLGNGQTVDSYVSKDGSKFFPQSMDLSSSTTETVPASSDNASATKSQTGEVSKKSAKPTVELFIMSYCPYGTQMQKGILPVLDTLGDKIDFKLKFVNYAMHGEKELKENLVQYCIQKNDPKKLNAYLNCFLKASNSADCLKQNKLNITSCAEKADKEFRITEKFAGKIDWQGSFPPFDTDKADNEKYGVQGSPTLVINGEEISTSRDSASILKTVCSAFEKVPDACNTKLSTAAPAPGFGSGTAADNGSAAQCN